MSPTSPNIKNSSDLSHYFRGAQSHQLKLTSCQELKTVLQCIRHLSRPDTLTGCLPGCHFRTRHLQLCHILASYVMTLSWSGHLTLENTFQPVANTVVGGDLEVWSGSVFSVREIPSRGDRLRRRPSWEKLPPAKSTSAPRVTKFEK